MDDDQVQEDPQILPVIQVQGTSDGDDDAGGQSADFGGHVPLGQTMPDSSALIPLPDEAADSDLIEKEWVLKAKQIVEHTAEDPFAQQEELSKIKTDYLKKRYNKDIGTAV